MVLQGSNETKVLVQRRKAVHHHLPKRLTTAGRGVLQGLPVIWHLPRRTPELSAEPTAAQTPAFSATHASAAPPAATESAAPSTATVAATVSDTAKPATHMRCGRDLRRWGVRAVRSGRVPGVGPLHQRVQVVPNGQVHTIHGQHALLRLPGRRLCQVDRDLRPNDGSGAHVRQVLDRREALPSHECQRSVRRTCILLAILWQVRGAGSERYDRS